MESSTLIIDGYDYQSIHDQEGVSLGGGTIDLKLYKHVQ